MPISTTDKFEHEFNKPQSHQHHPLHHVDRFQRNVFPEPRRVPPPPPRTLLDAKPRPGLSHQHDARQPHRLAAAKFITGSLEHTMVTGVDSSAKPAISCADFVGAAGTNFLNPESVAVRRHPLRADASQFTLARRPTSPSTSPIRSRSTILRAARQHPLRELQVRAGRAAGALRSDLEPQRRPGQLAGRRGVPSDANSSIYVMHGTSFNPSADNLSIGWAQRLTTPR